MDDSGCGAAWLARLLGVQEVPSSNLGSPTKFLKDLQTIEHFLASPFGVHLESKSGRRRPSFFEPIKNCSNSWGLSPPIKTRQTRHFGSNRLILFGKSMSGSLKKPDIHPTFPAKNPTFESVAASPAVISKAPPRSKRRAKRQWCFLAALREERSQSEQSHVQPSTGQLQFARFLSARRRKCRRHRAFGPANKCHLTAPRMMS